MSDVTKILSAVEQGDSHAAAQLFPLIYEELRRLAAHHLAQEKPGQTLDATSLVHEAYLRLVGNGEALRWDNRRHFFASAAEAMRRILVDSARRKQAEKHGGGWRRWELPPEIAAPDAELDMLALDAALDRLAECDPSKARLVELRFFAGLTGDQAAAVLGISPSTADREWVFARAWLRRELEGDRL